jgi:hypothetical protein
MSRYAATYKRGITDVLEVAVWDLISDVEFEDSADQL